MIPINLNDIRIQRLSFNLDPALNAVSVEAMTMSKEVEDAVDRS
jgi:hypothetical protein